MQTHQSMQVHRPFDALIAFAMSRPRWHRPEVFGAQFGQPTGPSQQPPRRRPSRVGSRSKTTRSQRTTIRIAYLLGRTLEDLGAQYHVSAMTVSNIVNYAGTYATELPEKEQPCR